MDHLLVERDLEVGSRRGDTAMATERTRSVGWVFAQAAQGSKPSAVVCSREGNAAIQKGAWGSVHTSSAAARVSTWVRAVDGCGKHLCAHTRAGKAPTLISAT